MNSTVISSIAALLITSVVAPGCAIRQPTHMKTGFDASAHALYTRSGSGVVKGQGFLRQRGGGTVTCAGNDVYLFPDTPYFREMVQILRTGGRPVGMSQSSYKEYARKGQCDAQGNFTFEQLPEAHWFITTDVTWSVGYNRQGGALLREVYSREGGAVQVLLTDKDFLGR